VRGWEANLADYSRGQKMRFTAFGFDRAEEAKAAFPSVRQAAINLPTSCAGRNSL
jgi:hypothetical protein